MHAIAPGGSEEPHEGHGVPAPAGVGGGMGGRLIEGLDEAVLVPAADGGTVVPAPEAPGTGGGLPAWKLPLTPAPTGWAAGTRNAFWQPGLGQRTVLPAALSGTCMDLVQCGQRITCGMT